MFTSTSLQIGDLPAKVMADIAEGLLNLNVSYTMDLASQLSFSVIDPGLLMASNNYFQVGRDVVYETTSIAKIQLAGAPDQSEHPIIKRIRHIYEISTVTIGQQESASPVVTCEALPKAIQQMKRDKKPGNIGGSGYEFVKKAALKYGLNFVGEKSGKIKSGSQNSGSGQQDSVWDRIRSIAQASQYVCFVSDGTMYFGTQQWLLFKWGTEVQRGTVKKDKNGKPITGKDGKPVRNPKRHFIPLEYAGTNISHIKKFETLKMPEITKRENDPMEAEGSAIVARDNGVALRPGMTIRINNIPNVQKYYLITEVSFAEQVTDPVTINFRTPERLEVNGKKLKIPQLPVGKKYDSDYFQPSPRIMGTATVGLPVFSDTTPKFVGTGTTQYPTGQDIRARMPNARRPAEHPYGIDAINLIIPNSNISSNLFLEVGNIDMWNRPLFSKNETAVSSTTCRTLSMLVHEKTIEGQPYYVIAERLFCSDGAVVHLSEEDAVIKYESENVHHGIFKKIYNSEDTLDYVNKYIEVLIKSQELTVMKRFPSNGAEIWAASENPEIPERYRCFT